MQLRLKLNATQMQLNATEMQLNATKMQLNATKMQLNATKMQLNASKMQLKPIPSQYHPYTVGPGLPGPHVLYLSLLIVSYLSVVVSLSLLAVSVRCFATQIGF